MNNDKKNHSEDVLEMVVESTMNKLLPCPFCGSEAGYNRYMKTHVVLCKNPVCAVEANGTLIHDVVKTWNTRTAPTEKQIDRPIISQDSAYQLKEALQEILKCEINRRKDLESLSQKPGSLYSFSDKRVSKAKAALEAARSA